MNDAAALIHDGAWYEFSVDALKANYAGVRNIVGPDIDILCSLKSNAYGLGASTVTRHLTDAGATRYAVGSLRDALAIRSVVTDAQILLYGGVSSNFAEMVAENALTVTLSQPQDIVSWANASRRPVSCFLKVDVGLCRFGFSVKQLHTLVKTNRPFAGLNVTGIYTHFTGESPENPAWSIQKDLFEEALSLAHKHFPEARIRCAASSEQLLNSSDLDYDCVDVGGVLFGLRATVTRSAWKPQHTLSGIKSRVASIRRIEPGDVGLLDRSVRQIGIVRFGWGDGFPRNLPDGAYAIVNGKHTPFVGPVHLEHIRLDLTGRNDVGIGDDVIILGEQSGLTITPEMLAQQWRLPGVDELYGNLRGHLPKLFL